MFLWRFIANHKLVLIFVFVLFIIPFFWLKPGQVDLGGDSTRLYFYDPASFVKGTSIYDIFPEGKGKIEPNYYYLPFVAFLAFLKSFFSSTNLINIFNGLKLAGSFLGVFLIVRELLGASAKKISPNLIYLSSILAGLFYVVSFGSFNISIFWDRAIMSHNQLFLNPLIFFLILKFFLTTNFKYLWIGLLLTFIFSPNFGLTSAPPFFAFYPLSILFILIFAKIYGEKQFTWRQSLVVLIFFLGVQAFQILPQGMSLFDKGSYSNSRVFSKEEIESGGVAYFTSVAPHGKAILNFLLPSGEQLLSLLSFIPPLIILSGFLIKKKTRVYLLISIFFLITFFLSTANITNFGFEVYKKLFYIPGFAMFRNFYTQWLYVFIFFYSILLGFAVYYILQILKPRYVKALFVFILLTLLLPGIPLFSGKLVNENVIRGSNNIKSVFEIDPRYEQTLKFVRSLPDDGKFLMFPLTDSFRQIIFGKNGGAYEGPSFISYLYNKYSFTGYQDFGYGTDVPAYAEDIMKYSREKDYKKLLRIFNILNIRYIYYDSDPQIYEKNFFDQSSYRYMFTSLPRTQAEYKDFIPHFPVSPIYTNGPYTIYKIDKSQYNSTIFIPDGIYKSNQVSFDEDKSHWIFIDNKICGSLKNFCSSEYKKPNVDINFKMINLSLYSVTIKPKEPFKETILVMQNTFHKGWKLVGNNKYANENTHILVNGYANGWLISGRDMQVNKSYTYYIKLDPQKYFWYGFAVTGVFLLLTIALLAYSFKRK